MKTRAACAEKLFAIYKIHGNFSRVYKEWALVEDASLREALQKAAVEVDVFSKSIDTLIDEEELIAEQLKEYYYFADSIKVLYVLSCIIINTYWNDWSRYAVRPLWDLFLLGVCVCEDSLYSVLLVSEVNK